MKKVSVEVPSEKNTYKLGKKHTAIVFDFLKDGQLVEIQAENMTIVVKDPSGDHNLTKYYTVTDSLALSGDLKFNYNAAESSEIPHLYIVDNGDEFVDFSPQTLGLNIINE